MTVFVPRIQPDGTDARQGQACAHTIAHFPAGAAESGRDVVFTPNPRSEAAILARAGVRAGLVERLQRLAQRWKVPLRDAARSLAAVDSRCYRRAVASACGLRRDCIDARVALRALHSAPEPYRLLTSPQPIPLDTPKGGFAVNAEDVPAEAIAALADAMGPARDRLILMSRRKLTAAIAAAYGPQIAQRASDGLRQRNPRLSTATGPVRWQIVFMALAGGLFLGAAIFALREALAVYSAGLSLMFLITISLRVAAALHACYRHTIAARRRYPRLSDAELPRYTVLVAMFREARVLPQLVEALGALDYPVLWSKRPKA